MSGSGGAPPPDTRPLSIQPNRPCAACWAAARPGSVLPARGRRPLRRRPAAGTAGRDGPLGRRSLRPGRPRPPWPGRRPCQQRRGHAPVADGLPARRGVGPDDRCERPRPAARHRCGAARIHRAGLGPLRHGREHRRPPSRAHRRRLLRHEVRGLGDHRGPAPGVRPLDPGHDRLARRGRPNSPTASPSPALPKPCGHTAPTRSDPTPSPERSPTPSPSHPTSTSTRSSYVPSASAESSTARARRRRPQARWEAAGPPWSPWKLRRSDSSTSTSKWARGRAHTFGRSQGGRCQRPGTASSPSVYWARPKPNDQS